MSVLSLGHLLHAARTGNLRLSISSCKEPQAPERKLLFLKVFTNHQASSTSSPGEAAASGRNPPLPPPHHPQSHITSVSSCLEKKLSSVRRRARRGGPPPAGPWCSRVTAATTKWSCRWRGRETRSWGPGTCCCASRRPGSTSPSWWGGRVCTTRCPHRRSSWGWRAPGSSRLWGRRWRTGRWGSTNTHWRMKFPTAFKHSIVLLEVVEVGVWCGNQYHIFWFLLQTSSWSFPNTSAGVFYQYVSQESENHSITSVFIMRNVHK